MLNLMMSESIPENIKMEDTGNSSIGSLENLQN